MADTTPVSSLPFPELTDQPNGPDGFNDLALALDHIVIPKYASSTARDNANTAPIAGDMCYLSDVAGYFSYNGSSWERWKFGQQYKVKLGNESVISSTTLQTDNELTGFVLLPSVRYNVRGQLFVSSHSTPDFKFLFTNLSAANFPNTGTGQGYLNVMYSQGDGVPNSTTKRWSQTQTILTARESFDDPNFITTVNLHGVIVNPTGGALTTDLQWAQNTSAAITTSVMQNSWIEFERA